MDRILIVEDDESIRTELYTLLRSNGYIPVNELPCELALLDVNLPGESGFTICRKIRESSNIPVIFLTARDTPEDELIAFGVGGDDFIRKPYNSSVLLARIARLLKRVPPSVFSYKGLSLKLIELKVEYEGESIELTKNEARILYVLMNRELCTRDEIIEDLWSNSMYIDENTLYVNISRLREKLSCIGGESFIRTVRGVGYRL